VAKPDEALRGVIADEAGGAGNQNSHVLAQVPLIIQHIGLQTLVSGEGLGQGL